MNLHEYQAKELLKKYNVPVQEGIAVDTVMAAEEAYRQIKTQTGNNFAVIKAQIHAGGRGKGKIEVTSSRLLPTATPLCSEPTILPLPRPPAWICALITAKLLPVCVLIWR